MARDVKALFTADDLKLIESMAGRGVPVEKISARLGIARRTFYRRLQYTPQGADALLKGRSIAEDNVTATAYKMATSGKHPVMTIFWLKCRAGWKDSSHLEAEEKGTDGDNKKTLEEKRKANLERLNAVAKRKTD